MKLHSYLSTGVVAGSFVLASSMLLAQTSTGTTHARKTKTTNGQSSAQPADIAVDHPGGNGPRGTVHTHANKDAQANVTSGDSANGSADARKKHLANMQYSNLKVQNSVKPETGPGMGPMDAAKIKSHSNQANNREAQPTPATGGTPVVVGAAKIKSHSNQANNRSARTAPATGGTTGAGGSVNPH